MDPSFSVKISIRKQFTLVLYVTACQYRGYVIRRKLPIPFYRGLDMVCISPALQAAVNMSQFLSELRDGTEVCFLPFHVLSIQSNICFSFQNASLPKRSVINQG